MLPSSDLLNVEAKQYSDDTFSLDLVAEQRLLGILILKPESFSVIDGKITTESFSQPVNSQIYALLNDGIKNGRPYNHLTILDSLGGDFFQNDAAKRSYLVEVIANTIDTNTATATEYALIIRDAWNKRRINAVMRGAGNEFEKMRMMADLNREISKAENQNIVTISHALDHAFQKIDETYKRGGGLAGLATGLIDLDNMLCGLEAGGLYVLAGRPGMGKTAAALTIGMNIAQQGKRVMFFSLEMSMEQIAHRINARYANVSIKAQKTNPQMHDFLALQDARQALAATKFDIVDCAGITAEQIVAKSFAGSASQRPDLIIIDHLGIVAARDARTPRVYQVGEMTASFKALAKDAQCPVLLLHQLNRGVEQRDDKRPSMSDLRDSGSVEQDADAVMLLYRHEYYLSGDIERREGESEEKVQMRRTCREAMRKECAGLAEIIVPKNRQGTDGVIKVRFDAHRQVFENLEVGTHERY